MRYGFWNDIYSLREDAEDEGYLEDIDFSFMDGGLHSHGYNTYNFLHGCCNEFADYLHRTYGYKVMAILEHGQLIHMYCETDSGYIDIRGVCDDFEEFMQDFTDNGLWENSDCTVIREYKKIPAKYRASEDGLKAAAAMDQEYGYYDPYIYEWLKAA